MNTKNYKWWWLFWVRKYKAKTRPKKLKRNIKKSYISYNTISITSWNLWIQQMSAIHVPYVSKNLSIPLWTPADTRDVPSALRDSKNWMERCIKPIALCVGTRWIRFTNCIFARVAPLLLRLRLRVRGLAIGYRQCLGPDWKRSPSHASDEPTP